MIAENSQQQVRKPCISPLKFQQIVKGDIVTYLLTPEMGPTNPLREWHGQVEHVNAASVTVSVLDEGYIGGREVVRRTEIIFVTKSFEQ